MIRFRAVSGIIWFLMLLQVWPGLVPAAHGQGSRKDDIVFNARGVPLGGAAVRVCAMPASGQPCAPLALIYTDAALTQALANPTATDGLGNYSFYAAPGKYMIEISGPGITTKQLANVILPSDPSAPTFNSISSTGNITAFTLNLSGNLNVNGNSTVAGNLASGTLNLSNQGTAPGTAGTGTVNLYTKTADKRLYYKDDTGLEIGPIAASSGAQTNVANTWTAAQNIDADFHTKGPNPSYDITRLGGYIGPNVWIGNGTGVTTGTMSGGSTTLTLANALDFANGNGILILGAGPAPTIVAPSGITATSTAVTGSTTRTYALVAEDWFGGRVPSVTTGSTATAVATQGVQTVALSSCNRVSGVVTCTTTTSHNFQAGAQVNVARGSTADAQFEGAFTITGVTANTFTFNQYDVPDASGTVTYGSAQVGSRVILKWNLPAADNTVLRTYVYMCTTTCSLPTNAANFALEGVAIGNDGYFVDMGYSLTGAAPLIDNGDAPATFSTTASNQWLSTTVTNGGGTTTVTLANPGTTSVAGARVLHDNSPNILAVCSLFPNNGGGSLGGVITIPVGPNSTYYFPIASTLDLTQCPGQTEIDIGHQVWQTGTIIPRGGSKLKGLTTANRVQSTEFYNMNTNGVLIGQAYPMIYMTSGLPGSNSSYETLTVLGSRPYQTLVFQDEVSNGGGVVSLRYQDVHLNGGPTNSVYVLKGGFSYFWERGGWGNGPNDFNGPPSVLLTTNCGPGNTGQVMPTVLIGNNTYLFGGGMVVDTCGANIANAAAGGVQLINTLVEGSYVPIVKVNTGGYYRFALNAYGPQYADLRAGSATPMFDLTNGAAFPSLITQAGCATGYQPLFETSTSLTAYNGLQRVGGGCIFLGAQTAIDDDANNNVRVYKNYGLKFAGTGRLYMGTIASPGAPTNAVAGGAGSVPAGSHVYTFTALDNDGNETLLGPGYTYVAADGAHTAVVTAPATFPAGAVGLCMYRDFQLVNATFIGNAQVVVPGGTVTDLTSFGAGRGSPTTNRTGLYTLSSNGFSSSAYKLNGESFSAVPRADQNVFLPGALTSTWTGSSWVLDKAITITRVMVMAKTGPATCATNAIVRVTDGLTPINVTVSAAGNDSGAITQNYAAGAAITTSVQTAAAGCGTSPADANVTIQYRMQ